MGASMLILQDVSYAHCSEMRERIGQTFGHLNKLEPMFKVTKFDGRNPQSLWCDMLPEKATLQVQMAMLPRKWVRETLDACYHQEGRSAPTVVFGGGGIEP